MPKKNTNVNWLIVNSGLGEEVISKHIYGHFSEHLGRCIYGRIWAGRESSIPNTRGIRNDIVKALHKVNIPVLRWPGGCFARDETQRCNGRVLTAGAINAHNTFEHPESVKPVTLDGATLTRNAVRLVLPAKSIVVLKIQ